MSRYIRDDAKFRARMGALTDLRKYGKQDSDYDNTFAFNAGDPPLPSRSKASEFVAGAIVLSCLVGGVAWILHILGVL